jgi:hypothetical protein
MSVFASLIDTGIRVLFRWWDGDWVSSLYNGFSLVTFFFVYGAYLRRKQCRNSEFDRNSRLRSEE